MYQEYFQLAERPFKTSPFAPHYFPSRDSEQALNLCHLAIDQATGPVMIIGSSGVGKSMVLAVLAEQYASQFNIVNLTSASLKSPTDLLQNILFELDRPYQEMLEGELRLALMDHLKPSEKCPNGILILADEAHSLNEDVLNELKSITNYVRDGQPRVRLILAGNARLEETMTMPRLDSFNQRIAARCYLNPLSKSETIEYVERHMQRVGQTASHIFDRLALDAIYEITQGIPRLINQVCCHAMVLAAANGQGPVDRNHVAHAWTDIQQLPAPWDQKTGPSNKQLEDWAVIEFGQLDDASESAQIEQAPIEQAPIEQAPIEQATIEQAATNQTEPLLEPESTEYQSTLLDPSDHDLNVPPTLAHSDDLNSYSEAVFSSDPFAESYSVESIGGVSPLDGITSDQQVPENPELSNTYETLPISAPPDPGNQNIFGDGFDEEEEVVDEVSRWSAEQNRSSLDVSDSELANLISQADSIQEQIGNSLENQSVGPEVVIQTDDSANQDIATPAIVTQADEIQQLYDIYDNQQQLANQIAIATQVYDPRDHPSGIDDDNEPKPTSIEYPIAEHTSYENPAAATDPGVQSDDRDMLMVSHVDHVPGQPVPDEPGSETQGEPSTGQAIRMDYQTLFQQLRGQDDSTAT